MRASLVPWVRTTALVSVPLLGTAFAQGESIADLAYALDTFALLMCAILVIHMKPGFALLEAGLHGSKNVINIFMKNYATFAIAGLAFWAIGFSIMYGAPLFISGLPGRGLPRRGRLLLPDGLRRHRRDHRLGRDRRPHEVQGLPRLRARDDRRHLPVPR
jgi:hypothetical protein